VVKPRKSKEGVRGGELSPSDIEINAGKGARITGRNVYPKGRET